MRFFTFQFQLILISHLFIFLFLFPAEFEDDPDLYVMKPIKYVGIEVWQVGVMICSSGVQQTSLLGKHNCFMYTQLGDQPCYFLSQVDKENRRFCSSK